MRTIIAALFLALLALGCTAQQQTTDNDIPAPPALPGSPQATEQPADVVEISMTARNWEFEPREIRVKQGQRVRITVTAEDVAHGVGIQGYTENVRLNAGETKTLEFTADKPGTFTYYCNVPCGTGHRDMRGTLYVE